MQVISRTHVGLVRENNEDALLVREPSLFAVADGMGGYAAGEIASRSTIKAFEAATHSLRHEQKEQNIRKVMLEAFDKANTHVFKMAVSNESYSGMGTTMTALYLSVFQRVAFGAGQGRQVGFVEAVMFYLFLL